MERDWEFDAEACCKAMKAEIKWEYEQMRYEDAGMTVAWNSGQKESSTREK